MRRKALLPLILPGLLLKCNGSDSTSRPTGGESIASSVYTIDPGKDTVLATPGGALVKVPAGSLEAGNAISVRLEIKEAYVLEDMVKGKLITPSDKEPLSSAGVLYLNATADGGSVSIRKPISITVPTKYPQNGMMVFTGTVGDSAAVSWADPMPLESNPAARHVENGKVIFQTNCATCHTLTGNVTAPPLAWITARRDRQWLFEYTRNSARMQWRGDGYSCYLFTRYNRRAMDIFPNLSDSALNELYQYIAQASQRIDSNSVIDQKRGFDSCAANDPRCVGSAQKAVVVAASSDSTSASVGSTASYYGFTASHWGWYNIAQRKGDEATGGDGVAEMGGGESTATQPERLNACPCWCDEAAYRSADSVAKAHGAPRPRAVRRQ